MLVLTTWRRSLSLTRELVASCVGTLGRLWAGGPSCGSSCSCWSAGLSGRPGDLAGLGTCVLAAAAGPLGPGTCLGSTGATGATGGFGPTTGSEAAITGVSSILLPVEATCVGAGCGA